MESNDEMSIAVVYASWETQAGRNEDSLGEISLRSKRWRRTTSFLLFGCAGIKPTEKLATQAWAKSAQVKVYKTNNKALSLVL